MSGPAGSSQWMYNAGGYEIANSLRLDDGDSAFLRKTDTRSASTDDFTISFWFKLGNIGTTRCLFATEGGATNNFMLLQFGTDGRLRFYLGTGTDAEAAISNGRLRDTSAWYHIVAAKGGSNAGILYINGVAQTTQTNQTANIDLFSARRTIGARDEDDNEWDGYIAEFNCIDGVVGTPANFGETGDYGEWKPKKYDGAYGDEGFYLDFKSSGVGTAGTTTIGADRSGNAKHYTSTNVVVTDQMIDTPTNNFATWNPLSNDTAGAGTLSEGNLRGASNQSTDNGNGSTISAFPNGKTYVEAIINVMPSDAYIGISDSSLIFSGAKIYAVAPTFAYRSDGILIYGGGSNVSTGINSFGVGDIVQLAIDTTANKLWIGKNNVYQTIDNASQDPSAGTGGYAITANIDYTIVHGGDRGDKTINFGQDSSFAGEDTGGAGASDAKGNGSFYYAPPTDFLALCTKNFSEPDVVPSENFNTVLYTGSGGGQTISGVGFQPDWTWIKHLNEANDHVLTDSVRGVDNIFYANGGDAETTGGQITSFNSDGFVLEYSGGQNVKFNKASGLYASFNWRAGTTGSGNTTGSGTAKAYSYSVNTTAGFSIVKYVGNGTAGHTIPHHLGVAADFVIVKALGNTEAAQVISKAMAADQFIQLTSATAQLSQGDYNMFNSTRPSSTVVTLGNLDHTNENDVANIMYAFAEKEGYSKFGLYKGNGNADGTFVYTGFRPLWILVKRTDANQNWGILRYFDVQLEANTNSNEFTGTYVDIVSNGFKMRSAGNLVNDTGTYIYFAFADLPFKYSNAQ